MGQGDAADAGRANQNEPCGKLTLGASLKNQNCSAVESNCHSPSGPEFSSHPAPTSGSSQLSVTPRELSNFCLLLQGYFS